MAKILYVDEFEGRCGFAYRHEPFCNGGHNCRHPEAVTEQMDNKKVGYCYAFSCPLASTAEEESFKKHGMDLEEFEENMYLEISDGWQKKKDEGLKALWEEFGEVPMNPETECIEEDWRGWKAGTFREDIWHWFDERHSKGVAYLMYGESCRKKICKRCGSQVQEEKDVGLGKEYPYYCPNCDENMYSFECGGGMTVNTKVSYLYRDGSNYKMPNEAVISGVITKQQIAVIMNCLDCGEYFIPKQVGLPEKRFGEWTEDDHCWFELGTDGFETTEAEPNVDLTSDEFVEKFLEAKGNWKESENGHGEKYARRFE